MTHTYQIDGMHCNSCISKVKNELLKIGAITEAEIQLESPQATITMEKHIPTDELQRAVARAGSFSLKTSVRNTQDLISQTDEKSWLATYKPLFIIFAFITGLATITAAQHGQFNWMQWMNNFMGGFFIAFSFFKLLDLKGFADSYSTYDLIARKAYRYAFVYPFIELGLGIAYIVGWQPFFTNIVTIIVMAVSSVGVIQSVFNKRKIRCACLGAVFNLPMSTITIIEDLLMVGMALFSLLIL
ncbi:MAG TPA: MauE/DoxX family redox-associated membrane protein [Chitinophagaceae bacterium]|nr:MauE/DoxX family redox-associated membrane protein [Chitinophagaceae bacterium]